MTLADIFGWLGYGLILYALPKLASMDKRRATIGWTAELLSCFLCITMGIMTGLTSVIFFNIIFAWICFKTIREVRNRP